MANILTEAQSLPGFASWEAVISAYEGDEAIRRHVIHNLNYWRWIHGGLTLVRRSPLDFDPRSEYWRQTERRLLVMFFANRFAECYAPAVAMRRLAFGVFRHFDRARRDGRLGEPVLATEVNWQELCEKLIVVTEELPRFEEYGVLRRVWRRLKAETLQADLLAYFEQGRAVDEPDAMKPASFYKRVAWFPYLGLTSLDDLEARQRFFYGFYLLFTSTNAYVQGGAMSFAPVLQNNPTTELLGYVERWVQGETLAETGFEVEGKSERLDRSAHAPVVELFGFLNLKRRPYYNNRTSAAYDQFSRPDDADKFDVMERIGRSSGAFLNKNPQQTTRLADLFRELVRSSKAQSQMRMEGIALKSVAESLPAEVEAQVERRLESEVTAAGVETADRLGTLEAAAAMLHLMLDANLYQASLPKRPATGDRPVVKRRGATKAQASPVLGLPPSLSPIANDALGYLEAGYHVLFAGPPGTGKTTLAQLVGHAWNKELDLVPEVIPLSEAPSTTVGNSAWAPLHTIGGILPDGEGGFRLESGIFIDRDGTAGSEWRLRPDCLVLDEMNRADLDRCIGELYPLLSRSVERVHPAGIPGVLSIRLSERFRIIATVNDATIDDIVFPISEGLARRFVRLELRGARMDELSEYLVSLAGEANERMETASRILEELFELIREAGQLDESDLGEHLPFGVGYFATLRSWVGGELNLSPEFGERDLRDQATVILSRSLRSAVRFRGLEEVLRRLGPAEGTG